MEVYTSHKGNDKIAFNGYSYRRDKINKTTVSWRCDLKCCKGRLTTPLDYTQSLRGVETGEHVHAPNPAKIAASIAVSSMKGTNQYWSS